VKGQLAEEEIGLKKRVLPEQGTQPV